MSVLIRFFCRPICILLLLGLVELDSAAIGQDYAYYWTNSFGGGAVDVSNQLVVDGTGNVYVCGYFNGTVDFDPSGGVDNHTSAGGSDSFVVKFASNGSFQWARTWGGAEDDKALSVAVGTLGEIYVAGAFRNTVDFDPGTGTDSILSQGFDDAFVSKYDSDGNYQWVRVFGGAGQNDASSVVAGSVDVYVAGGFYQSVDFDPGIGTDTRTSAGSSDGFLVRLDDNGNYAWTITLGSTGADWVSNLAMNGSDLYMVGAFSDVVDFDYGVGVDTRTSNGSWDMFLTGYDSSGGYLWTQAFGGSGNDYVTSIDTDLSGNIIVSGYFVGSVDFDPGAATDIHSSPETIPSNNDAFVTKYSSAGVYQWTRTFGSNESEYAMAVGADELGSIYVGGRFTNSVDFDPGVSNDTRTSRGSEDIFVSKFDTSGAFIGANAFGGTGSDVISALDIDAQGILHLGGYFAASVDFRLGSGVDLKTSSGSWDAFAAKYSFDATPLSTPSITAPPSGTVSANLTLSIAGLADPNSQVVIRLMEGYNLQSVANAQGNWSYTPLIICMESCFGGWSDGTYSVFADTRDSSGNPSATSNSVTFTIDTQAPAPPVLNSTFPGDRTDDLTPTFTGTGEEGTLQVFLDGSLVDTEAIPSGQIWSWTPDSSLTAQSHNVQFSVIDLALNQGTSNDQYFFQIVDDFDNDGLTTSQEATAGTDPHDADTDDDGVYDGQEVSIGTNPKKADTDNDLLTDKQELDLSTNPVNPDTDGDGLTDGREVEVGTNPLNADSDGDSVNDKQELEDGTDPLLSDTDDDGVDDGQEKQDNSNPLDADTDGDGLDDGQEKQNRTNPLDPDTDNDEVSDGQEVLDGSHPLDRGSSLEWRADTSCVEWNGFLGMWNILENVNGGSSKMEISSKIYDQGGLSHAPVTFGLRPGYQFDLLVHDLAGFQEMSYGLICSTVTKGQTNALDGRMVFYKPDTRSGGYQFAFAMPLGKGLSGNQYVPFNTYQPSLDPLDAGNLAANWIQVTNPNSTRGTGTLVFYRSDGEELYRQWVALKAGSRLDFSAHDIAGVKQVGLVEWIPDVQTERYLLRNVRYYYRSDGVIHILEDDFDSAFQLEGVIGSGQLLTVPLDTVQSTAVLELGNTLDVDIKVEVAIYPASGDEPLYYKTIKLQPHSTWHLITDDLLQGGQGIATVKSNTLSSVIATAMHYHRTDSLGVRSVYGIQAKEALGSVMRGSYNTFLEQGCRLLLVNPTAAEVITTISMVRYDGTEVKYGEMLRVPGHGVTNFDLCAEDQKDVYGVVTVQPQLRNSIFPTVLRIGENARYRFPTPVRQ